MVQIALAKSARPAFQIRRPQKVERFVRWIICAKSSIPNQQDLQSCPSVTRASRSKASIVRDDAGLLRDNGHDWTLSFSSIVMMTEGSSSHELEAGSCMVLGCDATAPSAGQLSFNKRRGEALLVAGLVQNERSALDQEMPVLRLPLEECGPARDTVLDEASGSCASTFWYCQASFMLVAVRR